MARNRKETVELYDWDPASDFRDEREMALFLADCFETGDMDLFFMALGDVLRAKKMIAASKKTGTGVRSPRLSPRKRGGSPPKSRRKAVLGCV